MFGVDERYLQSKTCVTLKQYLTFYCFDINLIYMEKKENVV